MHIVPRRCALLVVIALATLNGCDDTGSPGTTYDWIRDDNHNPVAHDDLLPWGATNDPKTDTSHAFNPITKTRFTRNRSGSWVNDETGATLPEDQIGPRGARQDWNLGLDNAWDDGTKTRYIKSKHPPKAPFRERQ